MAKAAAYLTVPHQQQFEKDLHSQICLFFPLTGEGIVEPIPLNIKTGL